MLQHAPPRRASRGPTVAAVGRDCDVQLDQLDFVYRDCQEAGAKKVCELAEMLEKYLRRVPINLKGPRFCQTQSKETVK